MSLPLMLAALSAQTGPSPVAMSSPAPPTPVLIDFQPGTVSCGGVPVAGDPVRPMPVATSVAPGQTIAPFVLTFRIAEDGRPLGIAAAPRSSPGIYFSVEDLQPALAASRFAAGAARATCSIEFAAVATPIATAPMDLIFRYLTLPHTRTYLDTVVQKRVRDASPGCFEGKPPLTPLTLGFPRYDTIPQPQGALSMTVVGFDIDASGKPVRLRPLASDGNPALDVAGRAAVARSRFDSAARTGCSRTFYRRQATPLAAPPLPVGSHFAASDSCSSDDRSWALPPRLTFPEPFRRRAIEGWAVIRFDVAPWGETGNVTVVANEPAALFGEQARQIIQLAKRPASRTGATGCLTRVLFKLPEGMDDQPPPPLPIID